MGRNPLRERVDEKVLEIVYLSSISGREGFIVLKWEKHSSSIELAF